MDVVSNQTHADVVTLTFAIGSTERRAVRRLINTHYLNDPGSFWNHMDEIVADQYGFVFMHPPSTNVDWKIKIIDQKKWCWCLLKWS